MSGCSFNSSSEKPFVLISQKNDQLNTVRLIDSITLKDKKEMKPIVIGANFKTATSDDGSTVAVMHQITNKGKLEIINTATWKHTTKDLPFKILASRLFVDKANENIYWIKVKNEKSKATVKASILQKYNIDQKKISTIHSFKQPFVPDRVSVSDKTVAVYGLTVNKKLAAKGAPIIYIINLKDGHTLSKTVLKGVKAGLHEVKPPSGKSYFESYNPGLTSDKDKQLMYITQQNNKVMTVDLENGKIVSQKKISEKISLLKRIGEFIVPTASAIEARVLPIANQALVSNDGERLYNIGLGYKRDDVSANGFEQTFSGLDVINTADITRVSKNKVDVSALSLSNDDKWLLMSGAYDFLKSDKKNGGMYVYNTSSMKVEKFMFGGVNVTPLAFNTEKNYAYVKFLLGIGGHNPQTAIVVVDLKAKKAIKRRIVKGYTAELLTAK